MAAETRPLDSTPFTYHWLASGRAEGRPSSEDVVPALWVAEGWHSFAEAPTITPAEMYRRGWRYHGPVAFPPGLDDAPDLPPLPPTMSAEDAAVLEAAHHMEKCRDELSEGGNSETRYDAFADARTKFMAAVRSRAAKQEVKVPHPICDHPTIYDAGFCCGQTPCTAGKAPDALRADGADREAEVVDRADEEARRVVGLRDAVVEAAMAWWSPEGVRISAGVKSRNLWSACSALRAAMTPPEPVDPRAELDAAIVDVLTVVDMSVRSNAQKVARVSRARAAMAREAK